MNHRLFAALDLPANVLEALAEVMARLREALPRQSVRWARPNGIHLTVRFYGETQMEQVTALQDSLTKATAGLGPIELELNGLGVFPNAVAPRVIWAGVAGDVDSAQKIQTALESDARALGLRPETRPFTPHLTLGRVNPLRASDKQKLNQRLKATPIKSPGRFVVNRLSLIKSELKPMGAVYTSLFSVSLNGPRPSTI